MHVRASVRASVCACVYACARAQDFGAVRKRDGTATVTVNNSHNYVGVSTGKQRDDQSIKHSNTIGINTEQPLRLDYVVQLRRRNVSRFATDNES